MENDFETRLKDAVERQRRKDRAPLGRMMEEANRFLYLLCPWNKDPNSVSKDS